MLGVRHNYTRLRSYYRLPVEDLAAGRPCGRRWQDIPSTLCICDDSGRDVNAVIPNDTNKVDSRRFGDTIGSSCSTTRVYR